MGRSAALRIGLLAALMGAFSCGPVPDELTLVGSVERTQVELVAPAAEVIVDLAAVRGMRVEAGDVLVRLDPTLAEAEVAGAEADLAAARSSERVAQHELDRVARLRAKRVASEQDMERAELQREEARARLHAAEARLSAARKRRADLSLTTPAAGVVDQIPFEPGERVPAGAVLVVILSDAAPWVRVWIPESSAGLVRPGTPAEIHIDSLGGSERPLTGHVLDVAREPSFTPHYALTERDRAHLVYEARVQIDDGPPELRPGVPADVTLTVQSAWVSAEDARPPETP